MLIILAGIIGGIVFIVSVTIVITLCLRRKSVIKGKHSNQTVISFSVKSPDLYNSLIKVR